MNNPLTTTDLAARYHVGAATARRWIATGQFPNAYRLGGTDKKAALWLVPESDLEGFVQPRRGPKGRHL